MLVFCLLSELKWDSCLGKISMFTGFIVVRIGFLV